MAARRLVIVMLVLLGISAGLAALVPSREAGEDTTGGTETETTEAATEPSGTTQSTAAEDAGVQTATIKVGGRKFPVVPLEVGEQLSLVVKSNVADQLEIPALGLIDAVGPGAPARFELLAEEAGDLGIRLVNAERVVARIEVRSEARAESDRPESKSPRARDRS
jgi:hypothetical protein